MTAVDALDGCVEYVPPVFGASEKVAVIVIGAEVRRHPGQGPVVICIFEGSRNLFVGMEGVGDSVFQGDKTVFPIGFHGPSTLALGIVPFHDRRGHGVLVQAFVSRGDVEVAYALHVGLGDDRGGMVAYHGGGEAVPAGEYGHPSALGIHVGEALHHFAAEGGFRYGKQGMKCPVGVPEAEITETAAFLGPDPAAVESEVVPVAVTHLPWQERSAVECTVKLVNGRFFSAFDVYAVEASAPDVRQTRGSLFETGALGLHVLFRSLRSGEGSGGPQDERRASLS